jgi:chromosomal replication initiation ATPase DnaA
MVWATSRIGHTLVDVADAFDRDHSTVAHHRRRHEGRLKNKPEYQEAWNRLKSELGDEIQQ